MAGLIVARNFSGVENYLLAFGHESVEIVEAIGENFCTFNRYAINSSLYQNLLPMSSPLKISMMLWK